MAEPDHPSPSGPRPLARAASREAPRRRTLFGAALILVLVIGAAAIFMLEGIAEQLHGRDRLTAVLPGPAQLAPGSAVWIGGRAVGEVERVEFLPVAGDSAARIAVTLAIPDDLRDLVRDDAYVRLTSARMIGPQVVDIVPGSPGAPRFATGDTLRPRRGVVTAADLMRRLGELRADAAELTAAAAALREPIASRAAVMDRIAARLTGVAAGFDALAADFGSGPLARTLADPEFGALLASLDSTMAAVGPAFQRAAARFESEDARAALGSLRDRSGALSAQLARLRAAIDSTGGGLLTRMGADSALTRALAGVRAQLDSLIAEAKANPFRFVF